MRGKRRAGFDLDVVVIGGCGHVGLPLSLAFADRGLQVAIYDLDKAAVDLVNDGLMPFGELGASEVLSRVVGDTLRATSEPEMISRAENVIFVVGTPIDEHLNPDPSIVPLAVDEVRSYLRPGQLVVLRSTLFPGVTAIVERDVARSGPEVGVVFCPERIAEGRAMTELFTLPQLVAGRNQESIERAKQLFGVLGVETVELLPEEAELAKLFTNTWRYIKFAAANQLYKIANDFDIDYERVRKALAHNYPRAADLPSPGFAAGPCLLKDTMQLAAFNDNEFVLGQASMMVNEGLPLYVVNRMARRWDLSSSVVGILGMAFKGESDDVRSSLSYKLRRILRFRARGVVCTDPYVTRDTSLVSLEEVLDTADLLVIGAPHRPYIDLGIDKPIVDIWGVTGNGVKV